MIFPKVEFPQVSPGGVSQVEYMGKLPQDPATSPRSFPRIELTAPLPCSRYPECRQACTWPKCREAG